MSTPRIRNDLQVTPAEEQGVKYFDVSDPRSGARMRLYDFEWLVAERMDGRRAYDEVALWARERLGIQPSASDLEEYARKLRELGFFEAEVELPLGGNGTQQPTGPLEISAPPATAMELEAEPPLRPSVVSEANKSEEVPSPWRGLAESPQAVTVRTTERDLRAPRPEELLAKDETPTAPVPRVTPRDMLAIDEEDVPTQAGQSRPPAPVLEDAGPPAPVTPASTGRLPTSAMSAVEPSRKSSAGLIVGLLALLVFAAAGFYYFKFMSGTTARVHLMVAAPREVVRLYEPTATIKKAEGQTLAFGESGKVSDVVAPGTEARAGMPLASLEAFAKVEKELADVRDRANYYDKRLAAARARGDDSQAREVEVKVGEKKKKLVELEARAAKVRLVAPGPGTVAQVLADAGHDVKAGDPVVKLADKRLTAEFELSVAEAAQLKPGTSVLVQPAAGSAPMNGRVAKVDARTVAVELADDSGAKAGDAVRLVKARVKNVVQVPLGAVVHRPDADIVYLLTDGTVHEKVVTVAERDGQDALITAGLQSGDQVVTSGAETLKDGQKAVAQ